MILLGFLEKLLFFTDTDRNARQVAGSGQHLNFVRNHCNALPKMWIHLF